MKIKFYIIYLSLVSYQYACNAHVFNELQVQQFLCTNDNDCTRFAIGNATVECVNGTCDCHYKSIGNLNGCLSLDDKFKKIIGGFCPCNTPNSECLYSEYICYCKEGYIPDDEKLRCLKKRVKLNEACEWDSQCQNENSLTLCDTRTHTCMCRDKFVNVEGECLSIAASQKLRCNLSNECNVILGVSTQCFAKEFCVCKSDYISSNDISNCLLNRYYEEKCNKNDQCLVHLGTGSLCRNDRCACDHGYYATRKNGTIICVLKKKRGQYCRTSEDCYEQHLTVREEAMICRFAECICQPGFHSLNDGICIPNFNTTSSIYQSSSYIKLLLVMLLCIVSKSIPPLEVMTF